MGLSTCVPSGCYVDVLVTEEFELDKPDAYQLKYYARGVGVVRVGWRGSKEEDHETLVLASVTHPSAAAIEEVRQEAFALEQSAYGISKDVWAHTQPLEPR